MSTSQKVAVIAAAVLLGLLAALLLWPKKGIAPESPESAPGSGSTEQRAPGQAMSGCTNAWSRYADPEGFSVCYPPELIVRTGSSHDLAQFGTASVTRTRTRSPTLSPASVGIAAPDSATNLSGVALFWMAIANPPGGTCAGRSDGAPFVSHDIRDEPIAGRQLPV
jgi:hypothetical protein